MKSYNASSIRNVCLLGHQGVGKTSLLEAACFTSKGTSKLGKVDNGTSVFDARPDEKDHKMTISSAVGFVEWEDVKINFVDTPGFLDLVGEAKAAVRVADASLILVDAADGVQVGTEVMSRFVDERNSPRVFLVNKLDKDNVHFDQLVADLKENFGTSVAPLTIPIGTGGEFKGIVNLMAKEAYEYQRDGNGLGKKIPIPEDMADTVDSMRSGLMEAIAESDEDLMNKYFEAGELTDEDMRKGLSSGVASGMVFPLLCVAGGLNMGVDFLLGTIKNICPSADQRTEETVVEGDEEKTIECKADGPTCAFVFKTTSEEHLGEINFVRVFAGKLTTGSDVVNSSRGSGERVGNMYFTRGKDRVDTTEIPFGDIGGLLKLKDTHTNNTLVDKSVKYAVPPVAFPEGLVRVAVFPKGKGDDEKLGVGMAKLHEEDPTFTYQFVPDIRQSILTAMGEMHIEIILGELKRRFKVEIERKAPKISYRETITKPVKYVEYTHKKQTGGAGQYARVFIDLEPQERGAGYEFVDKIVGGVIDQVFRPSVDKGIKAKMDEGILAGYPIIDVKVSLVDGKTHPVDSKDVAFQIAGREVFKKAFEMASPILLEPIVNIKVTIPDDNTGDVMGDLSSRRGRIGGMEPQGKYQTINAKVPESEVLNYSQALKALTQGRGFYTKSFSHYESVPPNVAEKVVEQSKQEQEQVAE